MTPKEALDRIAILSEILVDVSKSHIMPNDGINEIRKLNVSEIYSALRSEITELTELKHNVARFLVLLDKSCRQDQTTEEMHERWALEDKLSKVGKK